MGFGSLFLHHFSLCHIATLRNLPVEPPPTTTMHVLESAGLHLTPLPRPTRAIKPLHRTAVERRAPRRSAKVAASALSRVRCVLLGVGMILLKRLLVLLRVRVIGVEALLRLLLCRSCIDRIPISVVVLAPTAVPVLAVDVTVIARIRVVRAAHHCAILATHPAAPLPVRRPVAEGRAICRRHVTRLRPVAVAPTTELPHCE